MTQVVISNKTERKIKFLAKTTGLPADFIVDKCLELYFNSGAKLTNEEMAEKLQCLEGIQDITKSKNPRTINQLKKLFLKVM